MDLRRLLALLLLAVLVGVTGLASASPPDAGWITGLYDNGDFDDVVQLVVSSSGIAQPLHSGPARPGAIASAIAPTHAERQPLDSARSPQSVRAPPAA